MTRLPVQRTISIFICAMLRDTALIFLLPRSIFVFFCYPSGRLFFFFLCLVFFFSFYPSHIGFPVCLLPRVDLTSGIRTYIQHQYHRQPPIVLSLYLSFTLFSGGRLDIAALDSTGSTSGSMMHAWYARLLHGYAHVAFRRPTNYDFPR